MSVLSNLFAAAVNFSPIIQPVLEQQGNIKNKTTDYFKYENFVPPELYNAAIYARFSKDDGTSYNSLLF